MARLLTTLLIAVFAFSSNLDAESFELKAKKIKINKKNTGLFPEVELRPERLKGIEKEPKYKSDVPQKYRSAFGSDDGVQVSFAVDESGGSGKGFDVLYVDVTGSGNLKGKKLKGKAAPRNYSFEDTQFGSFEIKVPVMGADMERLPVQARFYKRKSSEESSLYLTSLCMLEGSALLDGKKLKMVVFDANCNGVFGEKGAPGGRKAAGDKIWLGEGSVSVEEACMNALPLGKYFLFNDRYYALSFNEDNTVGIHEAELPLGRIKVNNAGFLLELVKGGESLYVFNDKGNEINVPTGSYQVNTAGFRLKHKGKIWELVGTQGACKEKFNVEEDQMTELTIGPPLKIMVTSNMIQKGRELQANLDFYIAGSSDERYQYLLKDGRRVELPELSIRNSGNREVERGKIHYG